MGEGRVPSILVPLIAMMTKRVLLLSELTLLVLNLRLIASQSVGGLFRFFALMLVFVPIPRPQRFVHFALFMLEFIPVLALASARLV